jgi:hypothetical protein
MRRLDQHHLPRQHHVHVFPLLHYGCVIPHTPLQMSKSLHIVWTNCFHAAYSPCTRCINCSTRYPWSSTLVRTT